jgi:hypothetical protein
LVILAILIIIATLVASVSSNYYRTNNLQIPTQKLNVTQTQTIQPTSNPTPTPQPTLEPTPINPTTIIPKRSTLIVISPTNTNYSTNSIDLTYNINSRVLWSYYSIDTSEYVDIQHLLHDNGWISFKGNITLNLSEGLHRLKIAVQTEESRFSSVPISYQTIDFIINATNLP